jgi:hypothetical protein
MEDKDENLWRIAKKRASFKKQLATYIIINGFLWAMWWVTDGHHREDRDLWDAWPIWSTLGWGIGIAFGYFGAYHGTKEDSTMKEYQKLKDKEGR